MGIFNYNNFFKKKEEEKIKRLVLPKNELFDVEKFNDWFCNIYSGYTGTPGAKGIFLRTDKLSSGMITDWFDYLNAEYDSNDEMTMMDLIRKNWRKKLAEQ